MNPNYIAVMKQDLDNFLIVVFIVPMEKTTWLSPIVVVLKKNGKFRICMDFRKLNVAKKTEPYPLPFMEEILNMVLGHEVYSFLDGFLGYH
jgi:hypothetical protein